jgi:mRNA interferase MazF
MPTSIQPGDVVLVRFPFTDLSAAKLRPAIVLAICGDDLTIVGIFSGIPQPARGTWIPLSTDDPAFPQTGPKTSSVIKAERIAVIEQSILDRKLGSLTAAKLDEVKKAVKLALNLA